MEAAARRGVDRAALLARHGLSDATLADPDARLPAATALAVWDDAIERSGEPELAVLAAVELPFGAYRVVDYLCAHASTLGESYEQLVATFRIIHDSARLSLAPRDGAVVLGFSLPDGSPAPARYVDYTLAAAVDRINRVSATPVHPAVRLRRPAPFDLSPHRAAFGPDLGFGQPVDEVTFTLTQWATPTRNPDEALRAVLARHSELLLAELPTVDPWLDQLRAAIEAGLPRGRADLVGLADALGTSPRTLQRRLTEAGLSWRALLEDTRRALACAYLRDPALGIDEIALLLDYSDASTFHRAFVRWTGETPGRWRRTR